MKIKNFIALLLFSNFLHASNADNNFPDALIDADWLVNNFDDVVILDARKEIDSFTTEGHIENAILVDVNKIRIDREIEGRSSCVNTG